MGDSRFNHPKFAWSKKINQGHISEGYINFIFNSMASLDLSEYSIGSFMTTYGSQTDQIPGIVKGDVVIRNLNDNIQIAVKSSSGFNTASIGPYMSVAYQIIEFYDNLEDLTVENLQKILKNLKRYNQKIVQAGRKTAEKVIKDTVQSIKK